MKISYIKYKKDTKSFKIPKLLGMEVFEIEDPEKIDNKIKELKEQNYTSIIITNEIASFSNDLINKYKRDNKINIIITPNKRIND